MSRLDPSRLSDAQRQAVIMIASGLGKKQSAFRLQISESAFSKRLAAAMQKLGINGQVQCTHYALKFNLIKNLFEDK